MSMCVLRFRHIPDQHYKMTGDSSTSSIYRVGQIEIPVSTECGEGGDAHPPECYSIPIQIPLLICRRPIITFDTTCFINSPASNNILASLT